MSGKCEQNLHSVAIEHLGRRLGQVFCLEGLEEPSEDAVLMDDSADKELSQWDQPSSPINH